MKKETSALTIKDEIRKKIAYEIRNGILPPGQKISEESVARVFAVSRTPVREALGTLANEGFLEKIPNRGFFVRELARDTDYEAALGALEYCCAELALPFLDEQDLLKMEEAIDRADVSVKYHKTAEYMIESEKIHHIMTAKCPNHVLLEILEGLRTSPRPITLIPNQDDVAKAQIDSLKRYNLQHRQILQCLKDRDLAALKEVLATHWIDNLE